MKHVISIISVLMILASGTFIAMRVESNGDHQPPTSRHVTLDIKGQQLHTLCEGGWCVTDRVPPQHVFEASQKGTSGFLVFDEAAFCVGVCSKSLTNSSLKAAKP